MRVDRLQHFGQLARDQEHGVAVGGELVDQRVDLGLGADVDAARRLVEDQDRGSAPPATSPAPASAGCRPTAPAPARPGSRRPHAQPLEVRLRPARAPRRPVDEAEPRQPRAAIASVVLLPARSSTAPGPGACDPRARGRCRARMASRRASRSTRRWPRTKMRPRRVRIEAEDRLRDLRASGADEPGEAERPRRRARENETSRKPAGLDSAFDAQQLRPGRRLRRAPGSTRRAAGRSSARPARRDRATRSAASRRDGRRAAR